MAKMFNVAGRSVGRSVGHIIDDSYYRFFTTAAT